MNQNINILITSSGTRTHLIDCFKKELNNLGNVVTADCSNLAPTLYNSNKQYIVPKISDPNYISIIKDICKKENITSIISLIDPELSLLSKHIDEFREIGVTSVVSPYEQCELCLDKYSTAKFCYENNLKFAKTFNSFTKFKNALNKKEIDFPVFIKPQKGSASININKARNLEEAEVIFKSNDNMIIQEFLNGQEIGVDVYVDMLSNEIVSIFIKEKIIMRAGETDKARSIKCENLFEIIKDLVTSIGLVGPLDIDIFNINGEYYISEINPRFGGGYPLAYECGVNFPKYIINNLKGIINKPNIGNYQENIYMMKHNALTIKDKLELI